MSTGTVDARERRPIPTRERIERAIAALTGTIEQMPPDYSAKQVGGRRAHAAARSGAPLALAPVEVARALRGPCARIARASARPMSRSSAARGTYIRALARDLGRATESAAHLSALRRTRSGPFDVASATSFADLRDQRATLRSPREAIPSLAAQRVTSEDAARLARGMRVDRDRRRASAPRCVDDAARSSRSPSGVASTGSRAWCSPNE